MRKCCRNRCNKNICCKNPYLTFDNRFLPIGPTGVTNFDINGIFIGTGPTGIASSSSIDYSDPNINLTVNISSYSSGVTGLDYYIPYVNGLTSGNVVFYTQTDTQSVSNIGPTGIDIYIDNIPSFTSNIYNISFSPVQSGNYIFKPTFLSPLDIGLYSGYSNSLIF